MSEKLRNCPFCGGSNTASYLTDFGDSRMYCINCYEDGNGLAHNSDTWNTRPIEDELQRRIAELTAENAALREQVRWIPVSERLPEYGRAVLIMTTPSVARIGVHSPTIPQWATTDLLYYHDISYSQVTHWMPLPKPPEGE